MDPWMHFRVLIFSVVTWITKRIQYVDFFSPEIAKLERTQSRFFFFKRKIPNCSYGLAECTFYNPDERFSLKVRKIFGQPAEKNYKIIIFFRKSMFFQMECSSENLAENLWFEIRTLFAQCQTEKIAALLRLLFLYVFDIYLANFLGSWRVSVSWITFNETPWFGTMKKHYLFQRMILIIIKTVEALKILKINYYSQKDARLLELVYSNSFDIILSWIKAVFKK